MPDCPVNHSVPLRSKTAVLRFVDGRSAGSGNLRTSDVDGSTRTMALSPPSVIHGAPSGPMITPWGAEPSPSSTSSTRPLRGSSRPSLPVRCAVYQTLPSAATATSCGCVPAGTSYSWSGAAGAVVAGALDVVADFPEEVSSPPPDEHATTNPNASAAAASTRVFIAGWR